MAATGGDNEHGHGWGRRARQKNAKHGGRPGPTEEADPVSQLKREVQESPGEGEKRDSESETLERVCAKEINRKQRDHGHRTAALKLRVQIVMCVCGVSELAC